MIQEFYIPEKLGYNTTPRKIVKENGLIMEYRLPTFEDEERIKEYVAEHRENGENSISASLDLTAMDYREWVDMIRTNATAGNKEWGRSLLCLCMENNRIIGLLSIRPEMTREQSEKYGDIGLGVRPSERRKGYAYIMLRHALDICRECGMQEVILGCYEDNISSAAVIKKCGGILFAQNQNYKKGKTAQYYKVRL